MWLLVCLSIPIWAMFDASGWDFGVYREAVVSVHAGGDPYLDGNARQRTYKRRLALHEITAGDAPNNYVYPPVTLPLLRLAGDLPGHFVESCYWVAYALGALALAYVCMQAVEADERRHIRCLAPLAVFFPALLENGVILSGNVAYIVYGVAFLAAMVGWKARHWRWFYLTVLAASCVKPSFLSLLLIPVFSARGQWLVALLVALNGVAVFLSQLILLPREFKLFLGSVGSQLVSNRDFGCSPTGILASLLFDHGLPYAKAALILYLAYAIPLLCVLGLLSHRYKGGLIPLTRFMPVLFLGAILINPRIIEYDLAVLTIPLVLIVWRLISDLRASRIASFAALAVFATMNIAAFHSWIWWKNIACFLMVALFVAGARQLFQRSIVYPVQDWKVMSTHTSSTACAS